MIFIYYLVFWMNKICYMFFYYYIIEANVCFTFTSTEFIYLHVWQLALLQMLQLHFV